MNVMIFSIEVVAGGEVAAAEHRRVRIEKKISIWLSQLAWLGV